jgi:hypothetical protein
MTRRGDRRGGEAMRTRVVLPAVLLLVSVATGTARAVQGTCTITKLVSINDLHLPFRVPIANGVAMPVEFDEAAGTFAMSRDAWSAQFGAPGAPFPVGFGDIQGFIVMSAGNVAGTIDAAGNVTLTDFAIAFATDACPPRSPDYPITLDLMSGTQFLTNIGQVSRLHGDPLDFTTGTLRLAGEGLIPDACLAPFAILSGLDLTCTLAPIPDRAKLPPAPKLAKTAGKARIGGALPTEPPKKPDKGDVLGLKTQLVDWKAPIDFVGQDVYVRLAMASDDTTVVVLRVPAGKFQAKGKKVVVRDTDGTAIEVATGHKKNDTVSAAFGGTMVMVSGRKSATAKLSLLGLDLGALSGPATLTVAVGSRSASADVMVRGSGKSRKIH